MATAGRILIIPKGRYNEESTYDMLDMVSFGGKGWICKKTCIGIEPTEGEYWAECIDMSEEFADLESKTNPLHAVYTDEIDETLDSTTPEYPYIIGHSIALEELGIGSMVSVEILSPSEDYICQNAVGESGTASRIYDAEKGWSEWCVNAKTEDITEITETIMPNSCEGRLLFKEIVGKTEKMTSTGKNICAFKCYTGNSNYTSLVTSSDISSIKKGKTYTISAYITAPSKTGAYWNHACGVFDNDVSFTINAGTNRYSYSFVASADGRTSGELPFLSKQGNSDGVYITPFDVQIEEGEVATAYEPYGVGTPFIRSVEISRVNTHGKNCVDTFNKGSYTDNGVTITDNTDGTYTLNGTSTDVAWFRSTIFTFPCKPNTNYKLVGYPTNSGGHIGSTGLYVVEPNAFDCGDGVVFNSGNNKMLTVRVIASTSHTFDNVIIKPMVTEDLDATYDDFEPYCGSSFTFTKPIELNKIGDVQDVIVDGKLTKRITKKRITSDMDFYHNSGWENNQAFTIDHFFSDGVLVDDSGFATIPNILCSRVPTSNARDIANGTVMNGVSQNQEDRIYLSFGNCTTVDELKTFMANNEVYVYYELATPITALPTVDQVALNSLKTCDGVTYLEIDSPLEPTFKADYGTSKLGGYRLESLQMAKCNDIRISALEASVVNNI